MIKSKSLTALNISSVILILALMIIVFLINHFAPLYTDDYLYSFKFNPGFAFQEPTQLNYENISSPADYFTSLYDIYHNLTGRIAAHGLLQFILLFPPYVFDIINTLALFLFCILMVRLVVGKDKKLIPPYLLLAFSLFYLAVARTVFNLYLAAFACNYLWTQILTLLFLIPFRNHIDDDRFKTGSIFFAVLMLVAGVITGNTNEPIVPGVLMLVFLYLAYLHLSKKHIPIWIYTAFVGLCIGFMLLVFAPGNAQRIAYESGKSLQPKQFGVYLGNYKQIISLSLASIPAFLLAIIAAIKLKKPLLLKNLLPFIAIIIILIGILISIFLIPTMGKRLNIVFVGFYVMAALALLYHSNLNKSHVLAVFIIVLLPLLILKLVSDYKRLNFASREYRLIEQEISQADSDSVLVTPRGFLDPITRANWAKPIAVHYGLEYLWVHDVLDSTYIKKRKPVSFAAMNIINRSKTFREFDFSPALSYFDHNEFSRTVYVGIKLDSSKIDHSRFKVYYYSMNFRSAFWERVYALLPSRLRLFLMSDMQEYRDTPFRENPDGIQFAISTRNQGKTVDFIRLQVQYENRNIRDIVLRNIKFN